MTSKGAEKMNPSTIGVDVSKDSLDAHRLADGAARRFANDKTGRKTLIKWLTAAPAKRVVFEPTGPARSPMFPVDRQTLPNTMIAPDTGKILARGVQPFVVSHKGESVSVELAGVLSGGRRGWGARRRRHGRRRRALT
jgi:hypothetical protein